MLDIKTVKVTGTIDLPIGTPITIHQMPDGKLGFEVLVSEPDAFLELLAKTPECDDFRMLHSDHTWVAYSTMMDEEGSAVRAIGANPWRALIALREKMGY